METKTVISLSEPTPKWATWVFRIVFLITTAATMVVAADPAIPDAMKVRLGVYLRAADFFIWGVGRFIGQKKEDYPAYSANKS